MSASPVALAPELSESLEGHYAGAVTRLATATIDAGISFGVFALAVSLGQWLINLTFNTDLSIEHTSNWWLIPLAIWEFVYYWYCFTLGGKTPGCALMGLRVVNQTGAPISPARAAIRVITFPLSFMFFGLGFIGILLGRRRRAWHDMFAKSAVVYDWDARAARLRFLASRSAKAA